VTDVDVPTLLFGKGKEEVVDGCGIDDVLLPFNCVEYLKFGVTLFDVFYLLFIYICLNLIYITNSFINI